MSKGIHLPLLWNFLACSRMDFYIYEQTLDYVILTLISKMSSAINFLLLDIQNCCYKCWKQHTPEYVHRGSYFTLVWKC